MNPNINNVCLLIIKGQTLKYTTKDGLFMTKLMAWLLVLFVSNSFASLKLSTFNIRNFDDASHVTDVEKLRKLLLEVDADLFGVQEIVDVKDFQALAKKLPDYQFVASHCGGGGKQKLGYLYRTTKLTLLSVDEIAEIGNLDSSSSRGCGSLRPIFKALFQTNDGEQFTAMNVHLKAGSGERNYNRRHAQYRILEKFMNEAKKEIKDLVVFGDFNTTGYILEDKDYHAFQEMLDGSSVQDLGKDLECTSYWTGPDRRSPYHQSSVLDHILTTERFLGKRVKEVSLYAHCKKMDCKDARPSELGDIYLKVSDHCPVAATF